MNRDEKSFNGKDFLRNVSIEQEKSELIDRQNQLEQQKRNSFEENNSMYNEDINYSNNNSMPDDGYVDYEEGQEKSKVFDLKLDSNPEKKVSSTKKYIILSIGLSILFILIIIGLRVNSNKKEEAKLNNNKSTVENNINEQQSEEVGSKVNDIEDYRKKLDEKKNIEKKNILLPEQEEYKKPTIEEKTIKETNKNNDIFELNKKKEEEKARKLLEQKEIKKQQQLKIKKELEEERRRIKESEAKKLREKKVEKERILEKEKKVSQENKRRKESVIPPVEEKYLDKSSNLGGYYIQIGAFSKKPTQRFKNNILKKGFYYKIYEVDVKGKTFYKVLIGPYPVKSLALKVISRVKKEFNNQNAYILKF